MELIARESGGLRRMDVREAGRSRVRFRIFRCRRRFVTTVAPVTRRNSISNGRSFPMRTCCPQSPNARSSRR